MILAQDHITKAKVRVGTLGKFVKRNILHCNLGLCVCLSVAHKTLTLSITFES